MIQKVNVVPTNPIDLSLRNGIIAICISERKRVSRMVNDTITGHQLSFIVLREAPVNEPLSDLSAIMTGHSLHDT